MSGGSAVVVTRYSGSGCVHLGFLLTAVFVVVGVLPAQLATGVIEGSVRSIDGRPKREFAILIVGALGSRTIVHANSQGEFVITLPYGRYELHSDAHSSGATVLV